MSSPYKDPEENRGVVIIKELRAGKRQRSPFLLRFAAQMARRLMRKEEGENKPLCAIREPLSKLRFCRISGSFEPSFLFFLQGSYQFPDITPAKKSKNWSK